MPKLKRLTGQMGSMSGIDQKTLRELIHYNPETGDFTWLPRNHSYCVSCADARRWNSRHAGEKTGSLTPKGYLRIGILGKRYLSHRLAFLYMTGAFPKNEVDHINQNKADNRWENLRDVTGEENCRNKPIGIKNTSKIHGVYWHSGQKRWHASINSGRRQVFLGSFGALLDAAAARISAEKAHGYHENHGSRFSESCRN